jgi:hypothetical protein
MTIFASAASLALVAACATPRATPKPPDYRPVLTTPARPHAALYVDCLADAAANHRYAHASDPSTNLIVFTCSGAPARAFYDGLAAWSAKIGSQFEHDGRTFRSTTRIRENLFGVDYCATDGTSHECVISLNAGDFIR